MELGQTGDKIQLTVAYIWVAFEEHLSPNAKTSLWNIHATQIQYFAHTGLTLGKDSML